MKPKTEPTQPRSSGRYNFWIETLASLGQVLLAVFLYEQLGLSWLMYLGWVLLLGALLLGWRARADLEAGAGPDHLVTTGVYSLVRHPQTLSFLLLAAGLACISQTWLSAGLALVAAVPLSDDLRRDEQASLERFGEAYERYREQVPGLNLIAGVLDRLMRGR